MISTCRNVKTREEFFFSNFLFLFFYFNFRHVSNTVCGLKFASTNKQFFSVPRKCYLIIFISYSHGCLTKTLHRQVSVSFMIWSKILMIIVRQICVFWYIVCNLLITFTVQCRIILATFFFISSITVVKFWLLSPIIIMISLLVYIKQMRSVIKLKSIDKSNST